MNDKLRVIAGKIQSTKGTAVAVDLVTDYLQFSEFEIDDNPMMDDVNILSGSFSTEPKVPGNVNVNIKGKVPFCSKGAEATPEADLILKCAGFTAAVDTAPTNGSKFTFTRGLAISDISFSEFRLDNVSTGYGTLLNINSVMFNSLKVTIESGKVPMLEFSGVGLINGLGVAYITSAHPTLPTQTKIAYYQANAVTCTYGSTGYEFMKGEFEIVNKINQLPIWTGDGFYYGENANQETKFSLTMLEKYDVTHPYTTVKAGGTAALTLTYGATAGRKVRIYAASAQIDQYKKSKQGDLLSHDLSGTCIDNSLVITFNNDIT